MEFVPATSRLLAANRAAAAFYAAQLRQVPAARRYLRERGIEAAAGSWWQPGFAPATWTAVLDRLTGLGFTPEELLAAGLVRRSRTGRLIDYLRQRVVFPIHDQRGNVIGFTGRDLSGRTDAPKYLNTPTTTIYHKGEALFGLSLQLAHRRRRDRRPIRVFVVEGAADAIAVHRMVHDHAPEQLLPVALCGIVLTEHHLRLLRKAIGPTASLSLLLDGDDAGRDAFERWLPLLRTWAGPVDIATLPDGTDPAELLVRHGPEQALRIVLGARRPAQLARLDRILDRLDLGALDLSEPETRVRVWRAITPCFRDDPTRGADLADLAGSRLGLPLGDVMTGVVNEIA
ncbi:DNA primase [Hamadaea flava]|uniref:Toprim domain-containing protein n=1 Tax=Hamadaea flava TaxID=1742688 RepID=A0ABV8LSQ7_9ACTN|nr:toprim domain-containing protein [Hamadaea flava]MCP2328088.1 DNA primase [Hamadaea flava]